MRPTDSLKYRKEIDGLRAIAVLLVLIYHAFPNSLPGGFIGVDIFFVISGFLITGILWTDLAQERFSFATFYARRFRRLLPAFFIVVVSVWIFAWFALLPAEFSYLGKHMLASAGFAENFLLFKEGGYFDISSTLKILMHLWSLGVEEQFYIFWPTVMMIIFWRKWSPLLCVFGLFAISLFLNLSQIRFDATEVFYGTSTRIWELSLGAIIYFLQTGHLKSYRWNPKVAELLSWLAIGSVVWLSLTLSGEARYPGYWALIPTFASAAILLIGSQSWTARVVLSSRWAIFFGLISYPLYLWHWPLISFLKIIEGSVLQSRLIVASMFLSVALAYLTWRYCEQWAQRRFVLDGSTQKKYFTLKVGFAFLISVGLLGFVTMKFNGFPQRIKNMDGTIEAYVDPHAILRETNEKLACAADAPTQPDGICRNPFGEDADTIVWGDSHAEAIQLGLEKLGVHTMMQSVPGCPPLIGVYTVRSDAYRKLCSPDFNQSMLQYLVQHPKIKTVILVAMGTAYIDRLRSGTPFPVKMMDKNDHQVRGSEPFVQGYVATIKALAAAGKKVIVKMDHPELVLGIKASQCNSLRPLRLSHEPKPSCEQSRTVFDQQNHSGLEAFQQIQSLAPEAIYYNPGNDFCDEKKCYGIINGQTVYIDDVHLSLAGAMIVTRKLSRF